MHYLARTFTTFSLLLLISICSFAQNNQYSKSNYSNSYYQKSESTNKTVTHVDRNLNKYDWFVTNEAQLGMGSTYIKVERTVNPDGNGYYYFYVYFFSNSVYLNGKLASTYINDFSIDFYDQNGARVSIIKPTFVLVPPRSEANNFDGTYYLGTYLYSKDKQQVMSIDWGIIVAY